MVDPLGV